ncbi:MAG: hypothetical protein ACT4P5_00105 [Armatimonadota bacterium]
MHRIGAILVILCAMGLLVGASVSAASAQSIRLRLWATPSTPSSPGYYYAGAAPSRDRPLNSLDSTALGNVVWDSAVLGFEYRSRPLNRWMWSLSYETGSVTNLVDTEGGFGASPGTNRFFSTNIHYVITPLALPGSEVTVFAGYGYGGLEVSIPGFGSRNFDTRGLRYGVDFYIPVRTVWYLTGFAAYGRWSVSHSLAGMPTPPEGVASVRDYGAAVGRWLSPAVAAELGWKGIYWETSPVGGTPCPCGMSWNGFYAALNLRLP